MRIVYHLLIILSVFFAYNTDTWSQDEELFPGGTYNENIPTPFETLGHKLGEKHTFHWEMENFLYAVDKSSNRVKLFSYGKTYEERKLYYLVISSPENLDRLDFIRTENLKLTDPRKISGRKAEEIVNNIPSIVWLGYNIHGNETSGMEAAIRTIYQLAAGTEEGTLSILDNLITIIDPDQNPDGHDRYAQSVRSVTTMRSHPQRDDIEHKSPWPGGRTNHYYFDLNRDFYLKTQVETQKKTAVFHEWRPHLLVDFHEMGSNSTFFMDPPPEPFNEFMTPDMFKWWDIVADGNAKAFDKFGWGYYTKESFDSYYPGYGESYPAMNGTVGLLYEQASARGLSIERADGTILTMREAAWHHFIASMTTLKSVAGRRLESNRDFHRFFAKFSEEAKNDELKEIILLPGNDPFILNDLLKNLILEKVEIRRAESEFTNRKAYSYLNNEEKRETFPPGSYIISLNQPQRVLIKTLLAPESILSEDFIRAEKERKENRERSYFFDITAWSMPLTYGIETYWTEEESKAVSEPVTEVKRIEGRIEGGRVKQAYLIPFNSIASSIVLNRLLDEDFRVRISGKSFELEGKKWDKGTLVIRVNRNPESIHERIVELSEEYGIKVTAANTGLSSEGNDLGSNFIVPVKKPKIAIVAESPASPYSYGAIHYLFERVFDMPFTRISPEMLSSLAEYNVVLLPSGNYKKSLSKEELESFEKWIREGGTVISISSSTEWLRTSKISKIKVLNDTPDPENEDKKIKPDRTPGAILKVNLNSSSFLSYGCPPSVAVIVNSNKIYLPFEDRFKNIGVYESSDNMRLSGFIWPETEEYLKGKGYLFHEKLGDGKIIMFTEDPNFRAMFKGLNKLFLNAVLLGPSLR